MLDSVLHATNAMYVNRICGCHSQLAVNSSIIGGAFGGICKYFCQLSVNFSIIHNI